MTITTANNQLYSSVFITRIATISFLFFLTTPAFSNEFDQYFDQPIERVTNHEGSRFVTGNDPDEICHKVQRRLSEHEVYCPRGQDIINVKIGRCDVKEYDKNSKRSKLVANASATWQCKGYE